MYLLTDLDKEINLIKILKFQGPIWNIDNMEDKVARSYNFKDQIGF